MTFTLKNYSGWRIGMFDAECLKAAGGGILPVDDTLFQSPDELMAYLATDEGRKINFGPFGLLLIYTERRGLVVTQRFFRSLPSARRFHRQPA